MRKKRRERRCLTAEESSRAETAKLKRYATKSLIQLAEDNFSFRRQMAAEVFGFKIPDEAETARAELIACMYEKTRQRLEEDPEFVRKVTEANIRNLAVEMGLNVDEWERKPLTWDDYIESAKKYKELKTVMGVKDPGFLDIFKDPKVIVVLITLAGEILSAMRSPGAKAGLVLVKVDGVDRLVTREDYERLKTGGNVKHISDVAVKAPIERPKGDDTTPESDTVKEALEKNVGTNPPSSG